MERHLTHEHTWVDFGKQIFSTQEGQEIIIRSFDQDGDKKVRELGPPNAYPYL